jgi:phage tail sheath protein FI
VIDEVSLGRLDCVTFVSPALADVKSNAGDEVTDVIDHFKTTLNRFSSYAVADSGWKRQYDRYNDVYVNVPLNADIAGLCARTDDTNDPWFSPAGLNRGQIKNVVKLLWTPNQAERDELYKNGINPVANLPGNGVVLYGDKTLLAKPSAFDRINVRRLFIVLEKAVSTAAKFQLFEFNDVFTRAQFKSIVEPFLRNVRGRRGIFDFRVVCDETNNTGEVIDRNEFVADIFIKPARSINFIQLNFIATRTSITFEEIGA